MKNKWFFLTVLIFTIVMPHLCSASTLSSTWMVNGNGYTGVLILDRIDTETKEVSGTLLGTPVRGFLVGRHLILHRYPQGKTQIWDGWMLDPKLGAPGQPYYNGTLIIAGVVSENAGSVDGVYPWYAIAQDRPGGTGPDESNLIKNGGFERAPVGNNRTSGIAHWTVIRDNVDVVREYWQQIQGKNSIDLAGTYGSGAIEQTFPTIPGKKYEVSFFMAGNPSCDDPLKQMRVSAAGQSKNFIFDTRGKSLRKMGWERRSWIFSANTGSTTLVFENIGRNRACGIALDAVSVIPR